MAESIVANWYAGQSVLVTGATGFMGKIMVEKLLRSCPSLLTVYILVRPKKGKDPQERLEDYLKSPVFERLREKSDAKETLDKIKCIDGDIVEKNCGISQQNVDILNDSVTTVFHMAANVRFDQEIKSAVLLNVGGVVNVLELASGFKGLKVFVHVSTAYCHETVDCLEEKCYPALHEPRKILDLVQWMDAETLNAMTKPLLKHHANTYGYTKCLSEQAVAEFKNKFAVVIARPSIVAGTYKEPVKGWVNNLSGPTGMLVGAGKGVIRTVYCKKEKVADLVPVDMAINSLIIAAWAVGGNLKKDEVEVFNITASKEEKLTWEDGLKISKEYVFQYPFSTCLWYPAGSPKSNYYVHCASAFIFHFLMAYIIDFLVWCTGRERFMVKVQKRVTSGLNDLQCYINRTWNFQNGKLTNLVKQLPSQDQEIFYTYQEKIDRDEFFKNLVLGARKYLDNEDMDTVPRARILMRRLYYLDLMKDAVLYGLGIWLIFQFVKLFFKVKF